MSGNERNPQPETTYCIHCGEEISSDINFCPECGAERDPETIDRGENDVNQAESGDTRFHHRLPGIDEKNTTRRNALTGIGYTFGGLIFLGALGGGGDSDTSNSSNGDSAGNGGNEGGEEYPNAWYVDDSTKIVLRNVEGNVGQFSTTVTGDAMNESNQDYSYVQLQFGLYDASDAKIGDALANTSGLDAGQTWRFEAMGMETSNVDSFSLESVDAY